jgi:radical SAM-linked protein
LHERAAIRFAVEGDLRFISHHDSLRLFERALARAEIPVRYSAGFNPRPRMTIVLPRPVGVASRDELIVFELTRPIEPVELLANLSPQMPVGLTLQSAEMLGLGCRRRPHEAAYELEIELESRDSIAEHAARLLSAEHYPIERQAPQTPARQVDIRPYIKAIDVSERRVNWTQSVTQDGTARIAEVLAALGLAAEQHLHKVVRVRVSYQD